MTDNTQAELRSRIEKIHARLQRGVWEQTQQQSAKELEKSVNMAMQALLDWHNKQIEAVLDRLEGSMERLCDIDSHTIPLSAIEAERNKLKESKR